MRTETDLRQTLDQHAALAGEVDDVAAAIGTGIVRAARRRRLALTTGCVVVAVAAGTAVAAPPWHGHGGRGTATTVRKDAGVPVLSAFPVDLSPYAGYTLVGEQASAGNDAHSVRLVRGTEVVQIGVARGDHVDQQAGDQPVTVQGRPGLYSPSTFTVRWYRPDLGTVYFGGTADRDALLAQAEKVRPGGRLRFALPFRAGTLPAGYTVTAAYRNTAGPETEWRVDLELTAPGRGALTLSVIRDQPADATGIVKATSAGRPELYLANFEGAPMLAVDFDRCWVTLHGPYSEAALGAIADRLRVADFTDVGTWTDRPVAAIR